MAREIDEIPEAIEGLLTAIGPEARATAAAFRRADPSWVSVVARGTSDHAAVYARYLVEVELGLPAGLAAPSVTTVYRAPLRWSGGALLAVSQSGQSPDVVEVTDAARRGGAVTVAITNDGASPLAAAAEHVILCRAGAEQAVPATKTYVTQLVAVARFVSALTSDDRLTGALAALPERIRAALDRADAWLAGQSGSDSVCDMIARAERALVVSRGFNLSTVLEIALKLKETSGVFADGYSAADLLHGPLVLAGSEVPVLVVRPGGPMAESVDAAAEGARRRGASVWVIGSGAPSGPRHLAVAANVPEQLSPIVTVAPGYRIAERVARIRGLDPDHPLGLTKVTHTR
jgi:glucosamine--fructose-6-phosphate aminotransferase (isomerizing)